MTQFVLLVHFAATWYMTGVIWLVQVVHYPLFAEVGSGTFEGYQRRNVRLTTFVVAPAMLIEGGAAVLLLWLRPAGVDARLLWFGLGLVAVAAGSTALVQVPCHRRLAGKFDRATHRRLVRSNWIRTAAWTVRGLLAAWILAASR